MLQSVQKNVQLGRQRLNGLAEKRVLQSPLELFWRTGACAWTLAVHPPAGRAAADAGYEKRQQFIAADRRA